VAIIWAHFWISRSYFLVLDNWGYSSRFT